MSVSYQERFERNTEASTCHRNQQPFSGAPSSAELDGSLKKNSAMVTKLKTLNGDSAARLEAELLKLKFDKFIHEFAHALAEACTKLRSDADVEGWIAVTSLLHQRSSEFTALLLSDLLRHFPLRGCFLDLPQATDAKAEQQLINTMKAVLRGLAELVLAGVVDVEAVKQTHYFNPTPKDPAPIRESLQHRGGFILVLLFACLAKDMETLTWVPLALHMAKHFHSTFFPLKELQQEIGIEKETEIFSPIPQPVRDHMFSMYEKYYGSLSTQLVKAHSAFQRLKSHFNDIQVTHGELKDDQKLRMDHTKKKLDSLKAYAESLSKSLHFQMPDMKEQNEDKASTATISFTSNIKGQDKDWQNSPFEDAEMYSFYCDLVDLTTFVPESYLAMEKKKKKKVLKSNAQRNEDLDLFNVDWMEEVDDEVMNEIDRDMENMEQLSDLPTTTMDASSLNSLPVDELEIFLKGLLDILDAGMMDQAVLKFCELQHDRKNLGRKQLIQALLNAPHQRLDVLPYFARLIATLKPHIPEIGNTVVTVLHIQFKRLFQKQHRFIMEHRIRNIRFLGELVKFRICPSHIVFYCMHRLLHPEKSGGIFNDQHVEILCHLLETCGRFMIKSEETGKKFSEILVIARRKIKNIVLESRVNAIVENAWLAIDPPKQMHKQKLATKTPFELYTVHCLQRLTPKNVEELICVFKKFPWNQVIEQTIWQSPAVSGADEEAVVVPTTKKINVSLFLVKTFAKPWKVKYNQVYLLADLASGLAHAHTRFGVCLADQVLESIRRYSEENIGSTLYQRWTLLVKYLGELYNYRLVSATTIFETLYSLLYAPTEISDNGDFNGHVSLIRVRLACTLLGTSGRYFTRGSYASSLRDFLAHLQYSCLITFGESPPIEIKNLLGETWELMDYRDGVYQTIAQAKEVLVSIKTKIFPRVASEEATGTVAVTNIVKIEDNNDVQKKEEEENFQAELSKLLNESVESRKNEKLPTLLDLAVPLVTKPMDIDRKENFVSFGVLTKGRSHRSLVKAIEIPLESDIAQATILQQQERQQEQEEIKRLVLKSVNS